MMPSNENLARLLDRADRNGAPARNVCCIRFDVPLLCKVLHNRMEAGVLRCLQVAVVYHTYAFLDIVFA
jgi:hypothetical protein